MSTSNHFFYRIDLRYKGTNYIGWQVQAESDGPTIQGELNKILRLMSKSNEVRTIGSGRTDGGVHALCQVVRVEMPLKIDPDSLMKGLNGLLPSDIRVLKVTNSTENFHPIYQAIWKEYLYLFSIGPIDNFDRDLITYLPKWNGDLELMAQCANLLVGKHDFQNYFCTGTPTKSTVREIFECDLTKRHFITPWGDEREIFQFRVKGNGFLKQMVRLMVGSIWAVGQNKISLQHFEKSLKEVTGKLAPVAPPQGLYLSKVFYQDGSIH